jgi:bifunctional non-homologous end joining protein LigD
VSSALESLGPEERGLLRKGPVPGSVEPMKATLIDQRFSDDAWLFERKLDGIRCLASRDGREVSLRSRTDKPLGFPGLAAALERDPARRFVVDGEVVAFDRRGVTSFERLQRRNGVPLYVYFFDLLWLDGYDTTALPLRARKALLRRALAFHGPVRWMPHRNRDGERLYREACEKGLEGLIAKRADSRYVQGRSRDWLKFKCSHEQELVIGGFTAPKGSRTEFGALLVGYYEDGDLRYAGKVGTGFDRRELERLGRRLRGLEQDEPPFVDVHPVPRSAHWVRPELVAQVAFAEWTRDGRLRHPRYLGLREDKRAAEVVRERPS